MQLAVYNLIGALFAPPDPPPVFCAMRTSCFCVSAASSRNALPIRIFGPPEAAIRSRDLRYGYLQKLLRSAALRATDFIYSLRLNQAARLLDRRKLLSTNEPLSAIAYACGFSDYHAFRTKISPSVRLLAGRPTSGGRTPTAGEIA